jgi:hypothetical protein
MVDHEHQVEDSRDMCLRRLGDHQQQRASRQHACAKGIAQGIRTYHFRPTSSELVAMLRFLAETVEHPDVEVDERRDICELIIAEVEHSQQQIDIRMRKHAISDYLQWRCGEVRGDWKQLVVSSM